MRRPIRWLLATITSFAACGVHAQGSASPCGGDWFAVKAQVLRVEPPGATVLKWRADGSKVRVGADALICAGEKVSVPSDGSALRAVLQAAGERREIPRGAPPFDAPSGIVAAMVQALQMMADVLGAASVPAPPDPPAPTSSRGGGPREGPPLQIVANRLLESLPQQRIADDARVLLSWRDGVGPYACLATGDQATVLAQVEVSSSTSWCSFGVAPAGVTRLSVRDAHGGEVAWAVLTVAAVTIPRPAWLGAQLTPSHADRVAWAAWLWTYGGAEWRLQALAMLGAAAPHEWTAAYLRNQLLTASPRFGPR